MFQHIVHILGKLVRTCHGQRLRCGSVGWNKGLSQTEIGAVVTRASCSTELLRFKAASTISRRVQDDSFLFWILDCLFNSFVTAKWWSESTGLASLPVVTKCY